MSKGTTIKLEPDVKQALDAENLEGETYSQTVGRLLGHTNGGTVWTEDEIREIASQTIQQHARQQR